MKEVATYQKLRGGYYTPEAVADFLAGWAVRRPTDTVLEPSCGDGSLLAASARALSKLGTAEEEISAQLTGVELDGQEARLARHRLHAAGIPLPPHAIHVGDFFSFAEPLLPEASLFPAEDSAALRRFDVVIGNPPFIRYQNFPERQRAVAFRLMNQMGLRPNRLTNAWVPFVAVAAELLRGGGRLAMVVPAELLQVGYTAQLRQFLSEHFSRLLLITFRQLVFPKIQQEVVLLCAEKDGKRKSGINVVEFEGLEDLCRHEDVVLDPALLKSMDHSVEKWTQYYLTHEEIDLIRALREDDRVPRLGDLASVDVGVVTGLNEFFVLSEEGKREAGLEGYTRSIVTRSSQLKGIAFTEEDREALAKTRDRIHLLDAPAVTPSRLPASVRRYVEEGEARKYQEGYKCRIRKNWYVVPSVWRPDAFMLRQIHRYPKVVVNETGATSTDTIHRVRLLNGTDGRRLALACVNSLAFAFAEIIGRSYGGGVLELEPREAERLPVPIRGADRLDFGMVHALLLAGQVEQALDVTDRALLREQLGLSQRTIDLLRGIWSKLRDRRLNRKHRKA